LVTLRYALPRARRLAVGRTARITAAVRPVRVVLAALAVFAVIASGVAVASRSLSDTRPSIYGVRLGMTADEVRARVDARGEGAWSASAASGDWVLEHVRGGDRARFELHDGQLMAIRIDAIASPELDGAPLDVTPSTVLRRQRSGDRIAWTLLSRACPTHSAEAEALVNAGVASPR
jgi:hypothetical protein